MGGTTKIVGLVAVAAALACGTESGPSTPTDSPISLAKGGGQSGGSASLAAGVYTVPAVQPVTVLQSDDFLKVDFPDAQAGINMSLTQGAGSSACASTAGSDIKDELLAALVDDVQLRAMVRVLMGKLFDGNGQTTGSVHIHWFEAPDLRFDLNIGTSPLVTKVGDVYTITGGEIVIQRRIGTKLKDAIKHNMTCPNLDPIELTYPAP